MTKAEVGKKPAARKNELKALPKKLSVAPTRRLASNHNETLLRG
jgi:hypothetical protein